MAVMVTRTMRRYWIRATIRGSSPRCSASIIMVEAAPGESPQIADCPGSQPRRVNRTAMALAASMPSTLTASTTIQWSATSLSNSPLTTDATMLPSTA